MCVFVCNSVGQQQAIRTAAANFTGFTSGTHTRCGMGEGGELRTRCTKLRVSLDNCRRRHRPVIRSQHRNRERRASAEEKAPAERTVIAIRRLRNCFSPTLCPTSCSKERMNIIFERGRERRCSWGGVRWSMKWIENAKGHSDGDRFWANSAAPCRRKIAPRESGCKIHKLRWNSCREEAHARFFPALIQQSEKLHYSFREEASFLEVNCKFVSSKAMYTI
jgi:hypothetical protein